MKFVKDNSALVCFHQGEPLRIEPWGRDSLRVRAAMHDYIKSLYQEVHENGPPLLRAMFYEFPEDGTCRDIQDQYMFGAKYLAAPIFHLNQFPPGGLPARRAAEAHLHRRGASGRPERHGGRAHRVYAGV